MQTATRQTNYLDSQKILSTKKYTKISSSQIVGAGPCGHTHVHLQQKYERARKRANKQAIKQGQPSQPASKQTAKHCQQASRQAGNQASCLLRIDLEKKWGRGFWLVKWNRGLGSPQGPQKPYRRPARPSKIE